MRKYSSEVEWSSSISRFCNDHNVNYYDLDIPAIPTHQGGPVSTEEFGNFIFEYIKTQDLRTKNLLSLLDEAFNRIKMIRYDFDMAIGTFNSKEDVRVLTAQSDIIQLREDLEELRLLSDFK